MDTADGYVEPESPVKREVARSPITMDIDSDLQRFEPSPASVLPDSITPLTAERFCSRHPSPADAYTETSVIAPLPPHNVGHHIEEPTTSQTSPTSEDRQVKLPPDGDKGKEDGGDPVGNDMPEHNSSSYPPTLVPGLWAAKDGPSSACELTLEFYVDGDTALAVEAWANRRTGALKYVWLRSRRRKLPDCVYDLATTTAMLQCTSSAFKPLKSILL